MGEVQEHFKSLGKSLRTPHPQRSCNLALESTGPCGDAVSLTWAMKAFFSGEVLCLRAMGNSSQNLAQKTTSYESRAGYLFWRLQCASLATSSTQPCHMRTHTHTYTHARTHAHTHTHTCMHPRMHARTRAHTHVSAPASHIQVYERAVANLPPANEKRYWQR